MGIKDDENPFLDQIDKAIINSNIILGENGRNQFLFKRKSVARLINEKTERQF